MAYLSNILTYFKSSIIPGTQEQPFCYIYIIHILFVLYLLYLWRVIKQNNVLLTKLLCDLLPNLVTLVQSRLFVSKH